MKKKVQLIFVVVLVAISWYFQTFSSNSEQSAPQQNSAATSNTLKSYYQNRVSGKMIKIHASVIKLLADDLEAPRHQKFIVQLDNDMTVLVTHNIDLAKRINSLRADDSLEIYGQYEWNSRGGIIHWTHHDPKGRRQGGWIKHRGETYQ